MCKTLHHKAEQCVASAALAHHPGPGWERKWEEVAEEATRPILSIVSSGGSGASANQQNGNDKIQRPGTAGAPCVPHGPSSTSNHNNHSHNGWGSLNHTSSSNESRGSSRDSMGMMGVNAAMRGIVTSTTSVVTTSTASAMTDTPHSMGSEDGSTVGGGGGGGSEDLYSQPPCSAFSYNVNAEDGRWGVVTTAVAYAGGKEPQGVRNSGVGGAVSRGFGLWKKGRGRD